MGDSPSDEVVGFAAVLWNYHYLDTGLPEKADAVVVLGSHDQRPAERAAQLMLEDRAPVAVATGGYGRITRASMAQPEAMEYREIMVALGVAEARVLVEPRATNTGENMRFSRALLAEKAMDPSTVVLVTKPFMRRRAWATAVAQWPGPTFFVDSPQMRFEEYGSPRTPWRETIELMVGYVDRMRTYADLGYQVEQEVPIEVDEAAETLQRLGLARPA